MTSPLHRLAVSRIRGPLLGLLAIAGLAWLAAREPQGRAFQPQPPEGQPGRPAADGAPAPGPHVVRQGFPARGADANDLTRSETAWEVEWDLTNPINKPL